MLRYKSTLYKNIETLFFAPLMILGFTEEKQIQRLPMLVHNDTTLVDEFNAKIQKAALLHVSLSDTRVQIYNAHIHFLAKLGGVR